MGSFRRTVTEHLLAELPPGSKVASFSSTSDGILVYIGTAEGESWGAAPSSISGSVFVLFNAAADVLSRCHGVTRLAWGALLLSPPLPLSRHGGQPPAFAAAEIESSRLPP